ncbi:MAG: proline dehydrogenase family protein [Porphyromonadaceae bacterium]|nr:proline dehydrogenase family protein [Porphyromonadaceae bacterium]
MLPEKNHFLNFENTEIAFRDESNASLRQAYQLFKLMNNKTLVCIGKQFVRFALAARFPVNNILRKTIYRHFVGGMSIEDCSRTIARLAKRNVFSILDYAQEGEESEAAFDATCQEIIRTIEFAQDNPAVPFSVFKITGIARFYLLAKVSSGSVLTNAESAEYRLVEERVDAIFRRGYELDVPVMVDAEETWIQPVLDEMVMRKMAQYNKKKAIVQNTYQMYRHDSVERIKKHHQMAREGGFRFGLKIVRGAYMEKERARALEKGYLPPIQPDKESTDRDFNNIIHYFMDHLESIDFMVATHNEESSRLLASLIDARELPRNHRGIYFSQLYGMSDHITYNLAEQGYNVAKYVPYGEVKTMMPYLFRRAEENSSVKGQSNRELKMIRTEMKRRRSV